MTSDLPDPATDASPNAAPAAPRSLRDEAYELLKSRIIKGEFRPAEALSEAVVSAAMGLGRTPVRQAFDRLMHDGLVDVLPRKGILVRPISQDEIDDMIEARLVNESYCARLAAERADASAIDALAQNIAAGEEAARLGDVDGLMSLDRAFHGAISAAARNAVLTDFLRNLHERSQRIWYVSLRNAVHHRRVIDEHGTILEALSRHDADAAEAAMRAHILSFASNLRRQL